MNEIRQLCTASSSPDKHLDEILALFHACPPQHLLPSLSLIGQSISCMSIEQLDINIINHQLFLIIRQWSERLLQLWLVNGTLNGDEYRAIFYIHQLFKLLSEWLIEQDHMILNNKNDELIKLTMNTLFVDENFLNTICRVINQLVTNEHDRNRSIVLSHLSDNEDDDNTEDDHVSPDDIQLQTQTSDIQAEQADVLDVLFRCVNSLVILYSHPILLKSFIVEKHLTPCILHCLNTQLFLQLSADFLSQNITNDNINIRSIFILFTCLDYCFLSPITKLTFDIVPLISRVFQVWCNLSKQLAKDDVSPLIIRLIRFLNQLSYVNKDIIIHENICSFILPNFQILCQTSNLADDIGSLLTTICSTAAGRKHIRQLGFLKYILHETKYFPQLWNPLAILITQQDFYQSSFFKRLLHLLIQRTTHMFQSLSTTSNDTSFDSTSPTSRNQMAVLSTEWFILLRTHFLPYTMIANELITSTKKLDFIHMLIDTVLSFQHDDDISPKLIHVMVEILLTLSLNSVKHIKEAFEKNVEFYRWLRKHVNVSTTTVRLSSQAILSIIDSNTKNLSKQINKYLFIHRFSRSVLFSRLNEILVRSTFNRHSTLPNKTIICMLNADESHHELCITLRDRLQIEQQYTVEILLTSTCQSLDSIIHLITRSSLCLFCASTKMKSDNMSHFIYYYLTNHLQNLPLLLIRIDHDCEIDGTWLENISLIDIQTFLKEIRRHLHFNDNIHVSLPNRTNDISLANQRSDLSTFETQSLPRNFMQRPIPNWSSNDVSQWCEATQGNFETLEPLVTRLNGPALLHLAEILSIEPVSMYHSLNEELLQRTGSSVPLTEYVSLRSELQRLIRYKSIENSTINTMKNNSKKRKLKNSRFCTLF